MEDGREARRRRTLPLWRRPGPLGLALAILAGCAAVATATQKPTEALGRLLLPPSQEQELGERLAAQVRQQEPVSKDEEVNDWVQAVGNRIVEAVPQEERPFPFSFTVIDEPRMVNAFALPGGQIFIYTGMLLAAEDEAEVAGVLGHEVAHVTLGHPSQQLAAQVGVDTLRALALGGQPGLLSELATGIAAQGYLAANSRQDEAQADEQGLRYLVDAGYEARGMSDVFRRLQALQGSEPNVVERFFASHPTSAERVEDIEAEIRREGWSGGKVSIVGNFDAIQARIREGDGERERPSGDSERGRKGEEREQEPPKAPPPED